jgi:ABC-2 type transport system ATP-binding protein/lipopolysaccharide transport system ATP-binding protein
MSYVRVEDASVHIPIFEATGLRLLRRPSFGLAKVGASSVSYAGALFMLHALSNIDLALEEGDRVCIIGHNGAGKTTLLRLIAGIYPPSSGRIEVQGKVMALLGQNLAPNPDATGYENIKLIANLYDWPKERLPEYIRDIEEFTELGEYLALPARIYSAGMHARLAFAMATIQVPDVLLIDESIGAGDAHFQLKARARTEEFVSRAKIMLMASHAVDFSRAMCNKALLLDHGRRLFFGDIEEGLSRYAELR